MDTSYWTIFNHLTIWGSLLLYFILDYSYNYSIQGAYVGTLTMAMNEGMFWFTTIITVIILTIPVLAWRFYLADIKPSLSDRVRLKQRLAALKFRYGTVERVPSVLHVLHVRLAVSDLARRKTFSGHHPFVARGVPSALATLSLTRRASADWSRPERSCERFRKVT